MEQDKIEMWLPKNKKGAIILLKHYNQLAELILVTIRSRKKEGITLNELIEEVNARLSRKYKSGFGWYFLQVKQDLEARGVIKTILGRDCSQHIQIKKRNVHSYHFDQKSRQSVSPLYKFQWPAAYP